jgi:hypothetical protein
VTGTEVYDGPALFLTSIILRSRYMRLQLLIRFLRYLINRIRKLAAGPTLRPIGCTFHLLHRIASWISRQRLVHTESAAGNTPEASTSRLPSVNVDREVNPCLMLSGSTLPPDLEASRFPDPPEARPKTGGIDYNSQPSPHSVMPPNVMYGEPFVTERKSGGSVPMDSEFVSISPTEYMNFGRYAKGEALSS